MEDKILTEEEKKKRREERKKRKKYRLLILLLLLFGTGIMLTTSTYAWFTSNTRVSVNPLNVNIEAKNGIQISADATDWKSVVTTEDLQGVHGTSYTTSVNQLPEKLEPVSTTGDQADVIDGKLPMYYGIVDSSTGSNLLTTSEQAEVDTDGAAGKYIAYDLFFKVNKETQIQIDKKSGVTTTADQVDTGIKNASRVAFVIEGNDPDATANVETMQGWKEGSAVYIWEPNYDVHTAYGVANARDLYGITTTTTAGEAIPYDGIKAPLAVSDAVPLGSASSTKAPVPARVKFTPVTPNYKTTAAFDTAQQIFTLSKGVTKVRIYAWVEGQDVDCENNASGGFITFNLNISVVTPVVP